MEEISISRQSRTQHHKISNTLMEFCGMKYLSKVEYLPMDEHVMFWDSTQHRMWVSFKCVKKMARESHSDIWLCEEGIHHFLMLKSAT